MRKITLVTGNQGKLHEYKSLLPPNSETLFLARSIDLPEIQSLDLEAIVTDKLIRAYEVIKSPVIVEDVSAGLDNMGGLPGPFYKFFEQKLGKSALLSLAKEPSESVTIMCTSGYYDGSSFIFGIGELHGKVVNPRGENGFGFDSVVMPDGQELTMAEMSLDEKNRISHRSLAIKDLLIKLIQ